MPVSPATRRPLLRASALLLLGGLASGCAARIDPAASGLRLPGLFRGAAAAPVPGAMRWPDATWWQGFNAPQLDALMRAAMAGNLDLAAAAARLRQADAEVRISGAALLPSLDADASARRSRASNRNPGSAAPAGNSFGAGLSASYEVDFWGRNRAILDSARASATAARYAIGVTALSTQSAVANALFNALGALEQLEIQRGNLEVATRNLTILRQRLAVGTATGLDVAQQETVVAQQRAAIPGLQRTVEQNAFALGTLTGVPPGAIDIAALRLEEITVPGIEPGLPAELLARRPDVQQAEANLLAANANVAAARAALFPTIALTGSGGVQSLALETLLRPGSTLYSLTAGLTAPIFDGGALRAQVAQFSARQQELLATYRLAILAALQDTETSLSALQRATEAVALQRARERAAQRAYQIAEAQLQAGTVDLLTVLSVQSSLFSARNALADAQTDRLLAAAGLFTALGGGWSDVPPAPAPLPVALPGQASSAR
ncbi:efflux transporter outer membrane subunit [Falsiroseomonas selenitidurans]|uniref:Efflux transporter outer membrane subunit n=1 Tax=Falsiroseomonas selenitidurans TaxID=2716335 RepID=A0ABX1E5U0_9PROT|nr:efflux transporter outer membrane subunit [Falsiroseomonas selenitidurans]NKC32555.1 efflux transporter outer membrane subunit [Falsiroseomonas selenitidurans]